MTRTLDARPVSLAVLWHFAVGLAIWIRLDRAGAGVHAVTVDGSPAAAASRPNRGRTGVVGGVLAA